MVATFIEMVAPAGSDGQVHRAAQRLGLIAAAGELATALEIVPWQKGEAWDAAAWALTQWIDGRGGTEPAEVRQAIEQVRLFIEQYGESRFDPLDDADARPVNNRAGWRKGSGPDREWMIPPEVWKSEICAGLDPTMVARTLAERGMLLRAADGFQPVRKIDGASKRVYVVTANIFDGGGDEG
jgi:putative DNA primase/helicase